MAKYIISGETLTDIADAIRNKTGREDMLSPVDMPKEIESIAGTDIPQYEGSFTVKPAFKEQVLQTENKILTENITVQPITKSVVPNGFGGYTVTIGEE